MTVNTPNPSGAARRSGRGRGLPARWSGVVRLGRSTFLDARAVLAATVRNIEGSDYLQTESAHPFDPGGAPE